MSGVVCESSSDQAAQISFLDGGRTAATLPPTKIDDFCGRVLRKSSQKKNPPLYSGAPS